MTLDQGALFAVPAAPPATEGRKAGPKAQRDMSPLPWNEDVEGAESLAWFARTYLNVPRGKGAGGPMEIRPWQLEMCAGLYKPRTSLAVWVLPRGQGKSGLAAAIALHAMCLPGRIGARIAIVAQDERSALRLLRTAARMVELSPALSSRINSFKDRLHMPGNDGEIVALPAEAHRVEGADLDLAILDEIGFMPADTFEAAVLSTGKIEGGRTLCIGTPSPAKFRDKSPLLGLVNRGRANVDDPSFQLVEYGAPPDLDIHDPATWALANPALGDWLTEDTLRAQAPPTTRELEFRRARLGQWTEASSEPLVMPDRWRALARPRVRIPPRTRVVLALDGSMNNDSTAVLVGSVSSKPHFEIGGLWEPSENEDDFEVSHLEVEDRVIELAERFEVVEVTADPFRWQRTLQVLEEKGLTVGKFPQTAARLTPATNDLRAALNGGQLTHSGEERLSAHVLAASIEETARGVKIGKSTGNLKIDLAACLVMGYSRCSWLGSRGHQRKKKVKGYKG